MYATPETEAATLKEATAYAEEHGFTAEPTLHHGIHSGRQRYKITCNECGKTVHHATTGPVEIMMRHRAYKAGHFKGDNCDPFPTVWLNCSPALLHAGCHCPSTPRRAGPPGISHQHLVDLHWATENNLTTKD